MYTQYFVPVWARLISALCVHSNAPRQPSATTESNPTAISGTTFTIGEKARGKQMRHTERKKEREKQHAEKKMDDDVGENVRDEDR